jgi:hypothetical protein
LIDGHDAATQFFHLALRVNEGERKQRRYENERGDEFRGRFHGG